MTKDKDLEDSVSQLLIGKTIVAAQVASYDGLIEIDGLTFSDGSSISFGLLYEDGVNKNG